MKALLPPGGWLTLAVVMALLGLFTRWPAYTFHGDDMAQLAVSFKRTTPRLHECTEEELAAFLAARKDRPRHMQNARAECGSRERHPLALRVTVDGAVLLEKVITPSGWRRDAPVFVLERLPLKSGPHAVTVEVGNRGRGGFDHRFAEEIVFAPRAVVALALEESGFKVIRK